MLQQIGTFQISGPLMLSDPCYEKDTWCAIYQLPAKQGIWQSLIHLDYTPGWGKRVKTLFAFHTAHPINVETVAWTLLEGEVGVDSGQAGIFDENLFPDMPQKTDFYDQCCDLTINKHAGVLPFGVVAQSGLGDGGYEAFVVYEKKKIIAVKIEFITEEQDELLEGDEEEEDAEDEEGGFMSEFLAEDEEDDGEELEDEDEDGDPEDEEEEEEFL